MNNRNKIPYISNLEIKYYIISLISAEQPDLKEENIQKEIDGLMPIFDLIKDIYRKHCYAIVWYDVTDNYRDLTAPLVQKCKREALGSAGSKTFPVSLIRKLEKWFDGYIFRLEQRVSD